MPIPLQDRDALDKPGITLWQAVRYDPCAGAILRVRLNSHTIALDTAGGGWKISKIDDSTQGTNLLPLLTASTFCLDITIGDFAGAYALTSSTFQAAKTQAQFAQIFALPAGSKWLECGPDMATYRVTGSRAQFSGQFFYIGASYALKAARMTLFFAEEGGTWKVDDIQLSRS